MNVGAMAGVVVGLVQALSPVMPADIQVQEPVAVWGTATDPFVVVNDVAACGLSPDGHAPQITLAIDGIATVIAQEFQPVPVGDSDSVDFPLTYFGRASFALRLIIAVADVPRFDQPRQVTVQCGASDAHSWNGQLPSGSFHAGFVEAAGARAFGMVIPANGIAFPCEQPTVSLRNQNQPGTWSVDIDEPHISVFQPELPLTDGLNPVELTCGGSTWTMAMTWNGITPQNGPADPLDPRVRFTGGAPFVRAIPAPDDLPWGPAPVLATILVLMLVVILVGFPAEVVNETIKNNEAEINGWFSRFRRPRKRHSSLTQFAAFITFSALAASIMTFMDPRAGFDADTGLVFASLLVAIPVVTLAYGAPREVFIRVSTRERGRPFRTQIPGFGLALVLAAASRTFALVPGYTYGLIGTFDPRESPQLGNEKHNRTEAIGIMLGVAGSLILSILSFVGLRETHLAASSAAATTAARLMDAIYATVFVLGVQGVVFGLVPLRGMDGGRLWAWQGQRTPRWSRAAWLIAYCSGGFLFLHTLVLNREQALKSPQWIPSVAQAVAIFATFAVASFAFRGWFLIPNRPGRLTTASTTATVLADATDATSKVQPVRRDRTWRRLVYMTSLIGLVLILIVATRTFASAKPQSTTAPVTTCATNTSRGEIPTDFALDACVDSTNVWLHNQLPYPIQVAIIGDAMAPVPDRTEPDLVSTLTRSAFPDPLLLLPDDSIQISLGPGAATVHAQPTPAAEFYVIAKALHTYLPVGQASSTYASIAGVLKTLAVSLASYHQCTTADCRTAAIEAVNNGLTQAANLGMTSARPSGIAPEASGSRTSAMQAAVAARGREAIAALVTADALKSELTKSSATVVTAVLGTHPDISQAAVSIPVVIPPCPSGGSTFYNAYNIANGPKNTMDYYNIVRGPKCAGDWAAAYGTTGFNGSGGELTRCSWDLLRAKNGKWFYYENVLQRNQPCDVNNPDNTLKDRQQESGGQDPLMCRSNIPAAIRTFLGC